MKDLGSLKYFLGLEAMRTSDGICMLKEVCVGFPRKTGMTACKPLRLPLAQNAKLTTDMESLCQV